MNTREWLLVKVTTSSEGFGSSNRIRHNIVTMMSIATAALNKQDKYRKTESDLYERISSAVQNEREAKEKTREAEKRAREAEEKLEQAHQDLQAKPEVGKKHKAKSGVPSTKRQRKEQ